MILYRKFQNSGVLEQYVPVSESTFVSNPAMQSRKRKAEQLMKLESDYGVPIAREKNVPVYRDEGVLTQGEEPSLWKKYRNSKFANNPYVMFSPLGVTTDIIDAGVGVGEAIGHFMNDDYINSLASAAGAAMAAIPVVGDIHGANKAAKEVILTKLAKDMNASLRKSSRFPLRVQPDPTDENMLNVLHNGRPIGYFALDPVAPHPNIVERSQAFPFDFSPGYEGTGAIKDLMGSMVQGLLNQDVRLISSIDHTGKGRRAYNKAEKSGAVRKAKNFLEEKPRWVYKKDFGRNANTKIVPKDVVKHNAQIIDKLNEIEFNDNVLKTVNDYNDIFERERGDEVVNLLRKLIPEDKAQSILEGLSEDRVEVIRELIDRSHAEGYLLEFSDLKNSLGQNRFLHDLRAYAKYLGNKKAVDNYNALKGQLKRKGGIMYKK